jgi:hypothetical protein
MGLEEALVLRRMVELSVDIRTWDLLHNMLLELVGIN